MKTKQFILLFLVFTLIIYLTKKKYKENFSNKFLNHIYVINLDKSKDRMENIKRIARESNLNIERFPAIYGKNLNYDFLRKNDYLSNKKIIKFNGSLGCYMSHCLLWEKIYKENKYENVLILEDDCIIDKNFNQQMDKLSAYIPKDFDYIMLGSGRRKGRNYNDKFIIPTQGNVYGQNAGLFGYIVKVKNIPKLLKLVKPIKHNIYIDTVLRSNFNKLNVFIVKENIINHNYDFKTVRGVK
jgi:glycosyl transferase, family 25